MYSTTNIHHVKAIKVQADQINGMNPFISTKITFITEDGGEITISAFSKDFLAIEGADHLNFVAQPVEEQTA